MTWPMRWIELDHRVVDPVVQHVADEAAVDLQEVDRQRLQVGERRHAAAEVVEREAAAEAPAARAMNCDGLRQVR